MELFGRKIDKRGAGRLATFAALCLLVAGSCVCIVAAVVISFVR